MRRVLFAMLLVAAPHGVSDLTWDFAEGWAAQERSATATMVSLRTPALTSADVRPRRVPQRLPW